MKRQNTMLSSSSSYRETIDTSTDTGKRRSLQVKSVGCMSGIIQLVCKYHNRRKYLITFGKKPEKNIIVSSHSSSRRSVESPTKSKEHRNGTCHDDKVVNWIAEKPRRFSCEVPTRSPTIPPEIRRSNSVNSCENLRAPSTPPRSLVARLMGLSNEPIVIPSESTVEKRRKLLGALEKCDQDLKALKKIIDAVRCTELAKLDNEPTHVTEREDRHEETGKGNVAGEEQPSPVSVLDELAARSPTLTRCMKRQQNERPPHHSIKIRKPGELEDTNYAPAVSLSDRIKLNITEPLPHSARRSSTSPLPSPDHSSYDDIHHNNNRENDESLEISALKLMVSDGMKESVDQVCRDIEWGERREVGKIGMALQDGICRDLIEETVKELGMFCKFNPAMPPFESCKKRLCF